MDINGGGTAAQERPLLSDGQAPGAAGTYERELAAGARAGIRPWRRNVALPILAIVAALSYFDRQAFSIFMPQIGREFGLADRELGLIAGTGFAIFYVLGSFPIARYADRGDRPLAIALCVAVWSAATAACYLAANGLQLALIRIGLAAGEGGASPASQSLMLHIFPKERRTRVLAILLAANSVGAGAGGWIAGQLSQSFGWRESLVILGLPGLAVAAAVWLLLPEPRRGARKRIVPPPQVPLGGAIRILAGSASLRWAALAIIFTSTAAYPFLIWTGSFYQTVHGMSPKETGAALFIAITGGYVSGNILAGWLGDRFGARRPRNYAIVAAVALLCAFPFGIACAWIENTQVSLLCYFLFNVPVGLAFAPIQALCFAQVPPAVRAVLGATLNMITTLSGLGVATALVGALSTFFARQYGQMSLRYALAAVCFSALAASVAALMAGLTAKVYEDQR